MGSRLKKFRPEDPFEGVDFLKTKLTKEQNDQFLEEFLPRARRMRKVSSIVGLAKAVLASVAGFKPPGF